MYDNAKVVEEILARRRDRAMAIILSLKERECDHHLPEEASRKLRKVVLDQLNEYHELALDLLRSIDSGTTVVNEAYLAKLDEVLAVVLELAEDH
jgi:hypothetical protein